VNFRELVSVRPRGARLIALLPALVLGPSVAWGTQADPARAPALPGAILVHVTDTSINPLAAELVLSALGLGVRLSDDGSVLIENVPDGVYLIQVQHEGYASDSRLAHVAGDTALVDVALPPLAAAGGRPGAAHAGGIVRARMLYFVSRGATLAASSFITRAEVERRRARTMGDLLRAVLDVKVDRGARGRMIARSTGASRLDCADGMLVFLDGVAMNEPVGPGPDPAPPDERHPRAGRSRPASWRLTGGGQENGLRALRWVGPSGGDLVRVALDPGRVPATTTAVRPGAADMGRVRMSSVLAVEVYAASGDVPPEFQMPGAECGVVLIWTAGA
jgi:hypothetical protein